MDERTLPEQQAVWPSCLNISPRDIDLGEKDPGTSFTAEFKVNSAQTCKQTYYIQVPRPLEAGWIESISITPSGELDINGSVKVIIKGKFPYEDPVTKLEVKATPNGGTQNVPIHGKVREPPPPPPPKLAVDRDEIKLEPLVAGTRFTEPIMISKIGNGTLNISVEVQTVKWLDELIEQDKHFTLDDNIASKTVNISGYVPPTNEHFPGSITITSNGGYAEIKVTGKVEHTLYWGTNDFEAVRVKKYDEEGNPLAHIKIPQNFYIGHFGFGNTAEYFFQEKGAEDAGGPCVYAYWFLEGPGELMEEKKDYDGNRLDTNDSLKNYGKAQAQVFMREIYDGKYSTLTKGNTLFVDIEYPYWVCYDDEGRKRDCTEEEIKEYRRMSWGDNVTSDQQKRNREVLLGFLETLHTGNPNKEIGIYAAPGTFRDIMGEEFDLDKLDPPLATPLHVVIWLAHQYEENNQHNPRHEIFNTEIVRTQFHKECENYRIAGYSPVIWQFWGSTGDVTEQNPFTDPEDPESGFKPIRIFSDVPLDYWARESIEKVYEQGIMPEFSTCPFRFGPEEPVLRQDAAVYILKTSYGKDVVPPPATGTVFNDVPIDHPYAKWIEKLKADGFTSGRSTDPPLYYPAEKLTRAETAVLTVRLFHGTSYTPPNPSGNVFQDVPATHWGARWIEQLYRDDMAVGSSTDPPLYRPEDAVSRAEMAVFLMKTTKEKPGCGAVFQPIVRLVSALLRNLGRPKANRV